MDDERGAAVNDGTEFDLTKLPADPKPEKPRGKCTGCDFDYQLGTARTGEYKGELVIRKHNSRTGPGLCTGAQQPPEGTDIHEECACGGAGADDGCPNCSKDEHKGPQMDAPGARYGLMGDVVAVAPGGITITAPSVVPDIVYSDTPHEVVQDPSSTNGTMVLPTAWAPNPLTERQSHMFAGAPDPFTAPLKTSDQEDAEEQPRYYNPLTQASPVILAARQAALTPDPQDIIQRDPNVLAPAGLPDPLTVTEGFLPPMPQTTADPFVSPGAASDIPTSATTVSGQPEPDRDGWGRYVLFGQPHTRATTFAKLGANTKAIEAWNERNVIRGMTLRPDLLMLANGLEVKRDREQLNSIAAQAKDAAGSKVAANIGTAYHAFSERIDAGLITLQDIPPQYRGRVAQYHEKVTLAGLTTRPEWIERTTAVRADQVSAPLPVAGTLDRIFQLPDGSLVIGDLKTGSDLSYGEMEIEVQLALYAHGVNTHGLFDWNTKQWERTVEDPLGRWPLEVRTDIAIVIHLPADGDGCTLYVADIERGWRDAQRLGALQASLKDKPKGKRFRTLTAADLAPVTAPVERGEVAEYLALTSVPVSADVPEAVDQKIMWHRAMFRMNNAADQAEIAQLYQFALDSGKFHRDQLAVLVGLGKDRLNALSRA